MNRIGQHVRALANSVSSVLDREALDHDLTPLEFAVIDSFGRELEWSVTGLAEMLSVKVSVMSRVLKRLVDGGLLRRRRPRNDRRIVLLKLTEEGLALSLILQEKSRAVEEKLVQGVSAEDLQICLATIRKIVENQARLP